jgi:hypothetical protein
MDTGVVAVMHVNDAGGASILWDDARRVRAYIWRQIYGQ